MPARPSRLPPQSPPTTTRRLGSPEARQEGAPTRVLNKGHAQHGQECRLRGVLAWP